MHYDPQHCTLCPRLCGAQRDADGGSGICHMPNRPVLARAALHPWEEPSISGTRGAGTVFFSGCSLRCVFCQNQEISQKDFGEAISPNRLRQIFHELIAAGAHNIDLVNPTHFSHIIWETLEQALPVPVVWNSGGYDRLETLRALEGRIQVYLPDYKYPDHVGALRYSAAVDYPQIARAAIQEMARQTGPYCLDEDGLLQRGVLIRHLILPGRLQQAKEVMDWVASTFAPHTVLFSLMSQYLPLGRATEFPELNRSLRRGELRAATDYMQALQLDGYTQEITSAASDYIPHFDLTGVSSSAL